MELPLSPQVDRNRTEFGYYATSCGCKECSCYCRFMPGYLLPDDLRRLSSKDKAVEICEWAKDWLLASPGAVVAKGSNVFRVPTIVPALSKNGCIWLGSKGECTVHATAPFGCRFFNSHGPRSQQDLLGTKGLTAIIHDWLENGVYAQTWRYLDERGLRARAPEEARKEAQDTYEKER